MYDVFTKRTLATYEARAAEKKVLERTGTILKNNSQAYC